MQSEKEKKESDELIEKAKLLFDHQKEQYKEVSEGLRRLEDKAMKTFSALSIIITIALIIIRYWWDDIFPKQYDPLHGLCWLFLSIFVTTSAISWGFTFSAMQLENLARPSSDANETEEFYMYNERVNALAAYAREYSRLTAGIADVHSKKAKLINNCFESMLYGAWSFLLFLITIVIIKLN